MKKKLSLIILLVLLLAMAVCLGSCFLLEPQTPPDNPVEDPPAEEPKDEPKEEPEEKPTVNLSGITLPAYECVYDAKPHSIFIEGNLPDGVTVAYSGNGVKDAGVHTVTAKFYLDGEYLSGKDITSTVTITRATYSMAGVSFSGASFVYDGKAHTLAVDGTLPKGVSVNYTGNSVSAVGEHTVTANFVGDATNYEPIPSMTAPLRIVSGPAVFGGLSMPDVNVEYDAKIHTVTLGGEIPSGVSVSYNGNSVKNAGSYVASAILTKGSESMTLSSYVTIKPAVLKVSAKDKTVTYNGNAQSISLVWEGGKPSAVSVTTLGNGTAAIGTHDVVFRFTVSLEERANYVYHPDIHATLTINAPEETSADGLTFMSKNNGWYVTGYTGASENVVIPRSYTNEYGVFGYVVGIENGAFRNKTHVKYVGMPDTVKVIGSSAFEGCVALKAVTMSPNLRVIGARAFENTAIVDLTIPDSVEAIGGGALRGMNSLTRLTLPFIGGSRVTSNNYIGYIFGAVGYAANSATVPDSLRTVILSDTCPEVPEYSFFGADSIEEIIIGKGVRYLGISAFQDCTSLKGVYIPSSVTEVPAAANLYNSPVWGCRADFIIGTNVANKDSKPSGWGSRFDILTSDKRAEIAYGVDYEGYLKALYGKGYAE